MVSESDENRGDLINLKRWTIAQTKNCVCLPKCAVYRHTVTVLPYGKTHSHLVAFRLFLLKNQLFALETVMIAGIRTDTRLLRLSRSLARSLAELAAWIYARLTRIGGTRYGRCSANCAARMAAERTAD